MSFLELMNKVAGELPEYWQLEISLEYGAGSVDLFDPDGEAVEFPSSCGTMEAQVLDALEYAREKAGCK